ncbi:heat shock protein 33 [Klebsormidium nitens]|uniref:Heat shock protein 33 n=1 Tax=Klebsormidium nitens TaxID=105231 RepID=A0A1Y1I8T1_KLENI|nr:heat shock protein 33 [Klebsormidium nitens]|eukprot:GAQ87394.1 heat shock protein 33 [Klebsormidium nitens]
MAAIGQLRLNQLGGRLGAFRSESLLSRKCQQGCLQAWLAPARPTPRSKLSLRPHNSALFSGISSWADRPQFLQGTRFAPSAATPQSQRTPHHQVIRCSSSGGNGAEAPAGDMLVKALSTANEVSVISMTGTRLVQEAAHRHKTSPTASAALGRTLMGTLLLCSAKGTKGETLQVMFRGNGPLGQITAVADGTGQVRGFVGNPTASPPWRNGKLDVGGAVGEGILSVVRNHPTWPQPYTGIVKIHNGEIAEDLTYYLAESEQSNSAVGLGVLVNNLGEVMAAGGWLLEVLPSCSEITLQILEQNLSNLPSASTMVNDGWSARRIVETILDGVGVGDWTEEVHPKFGPCDLEIIRPRMERALSSLGKKELDEARMQEGKLEVRCEFCNELVIFGADELERIGSSIEPSEVS